MYSQSTCPIRTPRPVHRGRRTASPAVYRSRSAHIPSPPGSPPAGTRSGRRGTRASRTAHARRTAPDRPGGRDTRRCRRRSSPGRSRCHGDSRRRRAPLLRTDTRLRGTRRAAGTRRPPAGAVGRRFRRRTGRQRSGDALAHLAPCLASDSGRAGSASPAGTGERAKHAGR